MLLYEIKERVLSLSGQKEAETECGEREVVVVEVVEKVGTFVEDCRIEVHV